MDEYKANIDLWKHEDTLRQQRNSTFLGVNAALLVATGVIIGTDADSRVRAGALIVAAVVGLVLCTTWMTVQARHDAYIRFRRLQLRELEQELGFNSFSRAYDVFHAGGKVTFAETAEFSLAGREARSASAAEARLPLILVAVWSVALAGATAGLTVALA